MCSGQSVSTQRTMRSALVLLLNVALASSSDFRDFGLGNNLFAVSLYKRNQAAATMNGWVAAQTGNRIYDLIDPNILTDRTRAVLINALYFQANWTSPFEAHMTRKQNFYRTAADVVQVDMMRDPHTHTNYYRESPQLDAKFLEMPFEGGDGSMTIVLPNDKEGLAALESRIPLVLSEPSGSREVVSVAVPKFRIEAKLDLRGILRNLGIRKAFKDNEADFSGISGNKGDLAISRVIQRTYVDVNEEGVEAAAATYIDYVIPLSGHVPNFPVKEFIVDRPFIFFIKVKGLIIFEVSEIGKNNFLVSPLSAEIALALTQSGCKGATAEEIQNALHLSNDTAKVESSIKNFLPKMKGDTLYTFRIITKMYVKKNFLIKKNFKRLATEVYGAHSENVDFGKNVESARTINRWVGKQTEHKIENLVDPDDLNDQTALVLINALYFKAEWKLAFYDFNTKRENFYTMTGEVIQTEIMHKDGEIFDYYECVELNAKFLKLKFAGGRAAMVIALPNERDGLTILENNVERVFSAHAFKPERIGVALPKFKIESRINMRNILDNLGIKKLFIEGQADFGGISDEADNLVLSKIVQQVYIDVNEHGVEAAAATSVDWMMRCPSDSADMQFIVDHPFIFYIQVEDVIVFAGKMTQPNR
ncbi:Serpin domain containing protein [Asbolus verrucosus]|uniref:Serpin domain containing protein n=1 Tax=Asbolus verrucosus TaxID=1661398 RepID=A0A482VV16_ASBVE|nr:Serpin domain containing protein [Asbolus verrucosus]